MHEAKGDAVSDVRRKRLYGRGSGKSARDPRTCGRDESGSILVLALVFLVAGAMVVAVLTTDLTGDLRSSQIFQAVRSDQYAARSATDLAINSIRYAYDSPSAPTGDTSTLLAQTLNASPPSYCWGSGPKSELTTPVTDGISMDVWCSTAWDPTSSSTRTVTFSTCLDGVGAAACAASPYLQAIVSYDDYPSGVSAPSSEPCYLYCGTGMITDSWLWSPTVPTVTGISNTPGPPSGGATGSISGGATVYITGTGFVAGATVNFVEEAGGVPTSDNKVLSAQSEAVNSSTEITAVSPAITEGSMYFVTVTTPSGTSAYSANDIFTTTTVVPTVTGLSPATGTIAGGDAVTITGTGFFTGATVNFVQELNGTAVTGGTVLASQYVTVNGSTTITAVSPGVVGGSLCQGSTANYCYFVTVTTTAGTSATGSNDIFTYTPLVPICSSISPSTGSASTVVTILGTGFLTGATVSFTPESGGKPVSGTVLTVNPPAVAVISSSTITVPAPSPDTGVSTYFITVTTTAGTSQYLPIFTY
jgi:hypothetical protein